MSDNNDEFDISMIFDTPTAFFTLLYQCRCKVVRQDEHETLLDTKAVMIRATRLTDKGEKTWHYGDNRPNWLMSFVDEHADDIERRVRDGIEKRSGGEIRPIDVDA